MIFLPQPPHHYGYWHGPPCPVLLESNLGRKKARVWATRMLLPCSESLPPRFLPVPSSGCMRGEQVSGRGWATWPSLKSAKGEVKDVWQMRKHIQAVDWGSLAWEYKIQFSGRRCLGGCSLQAPKTASGSGSQGTSHLLLPSHPMRSRNRQRAQRPRGRGIHLGTEPPPLTALPTSQPPELSLLPQGALAALPVS